LASSIWTGYLRAGGGAIQSVERRVGSGPATAIPPPRTFPPWPPDSTPQELSIDTLLKTVPSENRWFKLLSINSRLLSCLSTGVTSRAGVDLLPASYYDQPERRYPVIFRGSRLRMDAL